MPLPVQIWIDTDCAMGASAGDVDDGFALAAALGAPGVEILGISAVAGNTDAATAERAVRALLAAFAVPEGRIPVVGAAEAPAHLAALPAGASLLALGPLTNTMAAVALDPELPRRLEASLVATVNRPWAHPILARYCLNSRKDPGSACAFLAAPWRRLRIYPLDAVQRLRCGVRELDRLQALSSAGAYLAHHSRRWLQQSWWRYRSASFPLWDLVAALGELGELPGARYDAAGRLVDFSVERTWKGFDELVDSLR